MFHFDLVQPLVHILHEIMEMNSGLGLDIGRQRVEEQVHKHRLAAANVAIHVEALGEIFRDLGRIRRLWLTAEEVEKGGLWRSVQGLERRADDLGRVVCRKELVQVLKGLNNCWKTRIISINPPIPDLLVRRIDRYSGNPPL